MLLIETGIIIASSSPIIVNSFLRPNVLGHPNPTVQAELISEYRQKEVSPKDFLAQRIFNQPNFFDVGRELFERQIRQLQESQPAPILTTDVNLQQWQPITSQAGGFSVWVPLGILSDDLLKVSLVSVEVPFRVLSSQTSIGRFVVAYTDRPNIETPQLLAALKDDLVKRTASTISNQEPITVDDHVGESLTLTGTSGLISAYLLIGKDRIYVVGLKQPEASKSSEVAQKFLTSFRVLR